MRMPIPKEYYKITDIAYKGKRIRTYSFGIGDKKIFSFPGFPHSGIIYLYLLLKYDFEKVQLITMDMPGWIGRSESVFENDEYDEEIAIDVVRKVIDTYNYKTFSVIGYSFGTTIATRVASMPDYNIEKVALISPCLNGKAIKDKGKRFLLNAIRKLSLFKVAFTYVNSRLHKYIPILRRNGLDENILDEYQKMVSSFNPKVVFTSLDFLFSADFSEQVKSIPPHKLLIANSREESGYFRKQAEHIRKIVDGEKSLYLQGNHEDFLLKPDAKIIKNVMRFLTR